jgi:hypothetical protein
MESAAPHRFSLLSFAAKKVDRLSVPDNFGKIAGLVITERKSCEQSGVALHFPPQSKKFRQEDVPNASARSSSQ